MNSILIGNLSLVAFKKMPSKFLGWRTIILYNIYLRTNVSLFVAFIIMFRPFFQAFVRHMSVCVTFREWGQSTRVVYIKTSFRNSPKVTRIEKNLTKSVGQNGWNMTIMTTKMRPITPNVNYVNEPFKRPYEISERCQRWIIAKEYI